MIFDQLRISDDGRRLYINLHVNRAEYFKDIYLDSLTIVAADKVSETSPHMPSEDYIYRLDMTDKDYRQADLVLTASDMNEKFTKTTFSSDLLFVYVKVRGVPDACTPCRLDEEITLGVTFDENLLYQRVMQYTRDLADDCQVPVGFADFILLWNAFKASVETEHYIPAIKYYNLLFSKASMGGVVGTFKPCGCHG